jgi:flagellar biosynthesis protein FlhG
VREQALLDEPRSGTHSRLAGYSIAVTGGKGGVGKTQVAANIALAMQARGVRTLLVDLDLGLANLDVLFGVTAGRDLRHVVEDGARPGDCILTVPGDVALLPAASGVARMARLEKDERQRVWDGLAEATAPYRATVLDTAAGIGPSVVESLLRVDRILLVTTPDPAALTDAYALLKVVASEGSVPPVSVVVNLASDAGEALDAFRKLRRVVRGFLGLEPELMAGITRDAAVSRAGRLQRPLLLDRPESPAARTLDRIGTRLVDLVRASGRRKEAS